MFVIAGHNGAGKSNCYRMYLREALAQHVQEHIDPDEVERAICADHTGLNHGKTNGDFSRMAQQESNRRRERYFENRITFSFETVLSDPYQDKVDFMRRAVDDGYYVALLAVGLDSSQKSRQRVDERVRRGGHDVATERIIERYPRVIQNIKLAANVASLAIILDNSYDNPSPEDGAYTAFSLHAGGCVVKTADNIPGWWQQP